MVAWLLADKPRFFCTAVPSSSPDTQMGRTRASRFHERLVEMGLFSFNGELRSWTDQQTRQWGVDAVIGSFDAFSSFE